MFPARTTRFPRLDADDGRPIWEIDTARAYGR
jgi:hypothetical protein